MHLAPISELRAEIIKWLFPLLLAPIVLTANAADPLSPQKNAARHASVLGYFETVPSSQGARNRLCVKKITDDVLDVYISTAYCPSVGDACMNVRTDGLWFQARLRNHKVSYKSDSGCEVSIQFAAGEAKILQSPRCVSDEHAHLHSSGVYRFIRSDVTDHDCEP